MLREVVGELVWWVRDVESAVLDNVSTFLLSFCTSIIFFPRVSSYGMLSLWSTGDSWGLRCLVWGDCWAEVLQHLCTGDKPKYYSPAKATLWAKEHSCLGTLQSLYERTTLATPVAMTGQSSSVTLCSSTKLFGDGWQCHLSPWCPGGSQCRRC